MFQILLSKPRWRKGCILNNRLSKLGLMMMTVRYTSCTVILTIQYIHTYIIGKNSVIAMVLLPYLIPDVRSKPEIEKIIQLSHVSLFIQVE